MSEELAATIVVTNEEGEERFCFHMKTIEITISKDSEEEKNMVSIVGESVKPKEVNHAEMAT